MLDHMTFRVTDIGRAKAFYGAALAPLGYSVACEGHHGVNILGFSHPDPTEPDGKKANVWFVDGPPPCADRLPAPAVTWFGEPKLAHRSMPFTCRPSGPVAGTTPPRPAP